MESPVNTIGTTMFPQAPSSMPAYYAVFMPCLCERFAGPLEILCLSSHVRSSGARADIGKTNMTLFNTHHDRRYGSTGGFSASRAVRRLRTALRTIHRAIDAARIQRLRNELRLHAATRAKWARLHQTDPDAHGDRFPRQPLHLGEKWDF